jgi:hypothetical protein
LEENGKVLKIDRRRLKPKLVADDAVPEISCGGARPEAEKSVLLPQTSGLAVSRYCRLLS